MMAPALRRLAGLVAALAVLATACSSSSEDTDYHLSAYFPQAVSLFEQSRIRVLGIDVGTVEKIELDGDLVRVDMRIDGDVPLPADVEAGILPLSLIGERNIALFPAWKPGMDRASDGDVIPLERTRIPAEIDEALEAFTQLARALNPEEIGRFISATADAVDGYGDTFAAAILGTRDTLDLIADQDEELLAIVADLHQLAAQLNTREGRLTKLFDSFAVATDVLADERRDLERFLSSMVRLASEGRLLIEDYRVQLPQDLAKLAKAGARLDSNAMSLAQGLQALPDLAGLLLNAYNVEDSTLSLRISGSPTFTRFFNSLLAQLGLPPIPCVPVGDVGCEDAS